MKDEGRPTGSSFAPHPSSFSVSVAICTYNGAKFLREQLDSIACQTRRPDEVVVGDDASTDDSVAIVEAWARETGIPTHISRNNPRLGVTENFQWTIHRCRGEFVCPCDQDDVWLPTKIEKTIAPLVGDERVTLCLCQSMICDEAMRSTGKTVFDDQRFSEPYRLALREGDGFSAFARHLVAPGHAMAFRRSIVAQLMPFPDTCVHDQWIAIVASALGRTAFVDEPLVNYRYHGSQVTGGERKSLAQWSAAQGTLKLDHLSRNIDTWQELHDRLIERAKAQPGRSINAAIAASEKVEFLAKRRSMRAGRWTRTVVALRLLRRGDYARWGRGLLTFLRDLKG